MVTLRPWSGARLMSDWIKSIIENFSYPGIFVLMVLENLFPPIPSELIVPLAGFVSTQGRLTLVGVIVAGTLGSVAGAAVLYWFGRKLGNESLRRWCDRRGHWIGLSRSDLDRSERWFGRHGRWTVLLGRMVPGVRSLISIPAGAAGMTFGLFLSYTAVGSAGWTAALAWAGHLLGHNYERVEHVIGPVSTAVVGVIAILWIVRVVRQARRATN